MKRTSTIRLAIAGIIWATTSLLDQHAAHAVEPFCPSGSSPRSDIRFCEDWETWNPVTNANFPDVEGSTFNGWTAQSFGRDNGHGYVQSTIKHSGIYALQQIREAGGNNVADIQKSFPANADFRMRFYLYLKSPYGNLGQNDEDNIHLVFLNTAASSTGQRLDIVPYVNWPETWPPTCYAGGNGDGRNGYFSVGSRNQYYVGTTTGDPTKCYNLAIHKDEWILVEWAYKVTSSTTGLVNLWVNGTQLATNVSMPPDSRHLTTSSIIVSGWWSRTLATRAELYIDDIVVSNNSALTIGPRVASDDVVPPAAPQNLRLQ